MNVAILGLGYVGLTAAGCLIRQGHTVFGVDANERKVDQIRTGVSPIHEPGLEALIQEGLSLGRLTVSRSIDGWLDACDIALVCVGTPSAPDGSHDMTHVAEVSRQLASRIDAARPHPLVVAFRSTFRPGTLDQLVLPIFRGILGDALDSVELVYYPEFMRESVAIEDYFHPPRIVIGTRDGHPCRQLDRLNEGIEAPVFHTRYRESEMVKFVDNSFHALKVTFSNEIGRICRKNGISAQEIYHIFVSDTKLNISKAYLRPGGAFGGSCLPKDLRALSVLAEDIGANVFTIDSILKSNEAHKRFLFEHSTAGLRNGARLLMIGLAFKADSDDLRESPNLDLARRMLQAGFEVEIFDPAVDPAKLIGANLGYAYAHLPSIASLLVSRADAEGRCYDRVIDTNGRAKGMALAPAITIDINAFV